MNLHVYRYFHSSLKVCVCVCVCICVCVFLLRETKSDDIPVAIKRLLDT